MMTVRRKIILASVLGASLAAAALPATAQQQQQPVPNALQGLAQNRDKPVQIRAQSFEVRDKEKRATFSGNVHVVQGETTIRCKSLVVSYEPGSTGAPASQPGPASRGQISKLDALGGVVVTQKDQTASGDSGHFDLRANIITLSGNVVVSQGGNVMRGERLVVDLNSGVSRIESGKNRGQVEMLVPQNNNQKPGTPAAPGREMPRLDLMRPGQQN